MTAARPAAATAADIKLPAMKAEALRDQTLGTAGLGSLNPDATLIVFAAALLAESDDHYTASAAAGILQRARKVSLEMLGAAVTQVTRELGPAMLAFWQKFVKDTWQDAANPPPSYVDAAIVARRKEAEEQEQERNRQNAARYLDNVKTTLEALKIDEKEFPQNTEPAKPRAPRIDVGGFLHSLLYKPAGAPANTTASATPGWLTPPLINPGDEDITIFDNDIMEIVGAKKLAGDPAWQKLEERGFERRRIVQAVFNVRKTAQAQLAQCDQILAVIRTDYEQHIEPVIKAATLLGHAVSVVNSFYGPLLAGGDAMPAPPPVAPRPPTAPHPRGR